MPRERFQLVMPVAVGCLMVLVAAGASTAAALSALAACLAVLLPDLMHVAAMRQLLRERPRDMARKVVRNRGWRLASVIVFIAVSLQVLGGEIVVGAWLAALIVQAALPPLLSLAHATTGKR